MNLFVHSRFLIIRLALSYIPLFRYNIYVSVELIIILSERNVNMDINRMNYVETYVNNHKKSTLAVYLLWFFLGGLGVHRFYMGKTVSGAILLMITLFFSWATYFLITGVWLLIDLFLIPGWIREDKERLRQEALLNSMDS